VDERLTGKATQAVEGRGLLEKWQQFVVSDARRAHVDGRPSELKGSVGLFSLPWSAPKVAGETREGRYS
jgi:hypothetical protein